MPRYSRYRKSNASVDCRAIYCSNECSMVSSWYGDYIPLIIEIIAPIISRVNLEVQFMIRFDRLWKTMEEKKITTYQLREQCGIDSKTIRRLKANENIETKTLNKLCAVLQCGLEDIAHYTEDDPSAS